MRILNLISAIIFVSSVAIAEEVPVHGFNAAQTAEMQAYNKNVAANQFLNGLFENLSTNTNSLDVNRRPFAEYEDAGYLLFSDSGAFDSWENKLAMAKNVPENVTVVVFTGESDTAYQKQLFEVFSQQIAPERLKVVYLPGSRNGFWARDGIPVPTWKTDSAGQKNFAVVDARYYFPFEADQEVSEFFNADLVSLPYYTEGGNFMNNSKGDCVVVNNVRVEVIPDSEYTQKYGCKTILRFPHIKGIGHIDEALKFMDDDTVVTDTPQYVDGLEKAGFDVIMLPRPKNHYETYANAMVINGTAFVPVFGQSTDAEAIKVYESFGLKVFPLNSSVLSNDGLGSIHCITMTYPPVEFNELLSHIGAETF